MRLVKLIAATAFFAVIFAFGPASAAEWTVNRVSQPAKYTNDGKTWHLIKRGTTIPNSSWINTGRGGRVALQRGDDTMMITGYTLIAAVERGTDARPKTTLIQRYGKITVDVEKRGYDQMTVKTPFMAAVVKGTKFTVTGTKHGSDIRVARGLVEVANIKSGQKAYVGAGGKAEIGASDQSIEISGSNTEMLTSSIAGSKNNAAEGAGSNGAAKSGNVNAGPGANNAGGNGNGNSGSGNSNAGGNGNGNSGSGNSNAGGNGNGNGKN